MSTMPPKQNVKPGTVSSNIAKNKGAALDKRSTKNTDLPLPKPKTSAATGSQPATTDNGDFMGQTYKDHYDRSVLFINKLLERLSKYEEEVDRLNDAFAKNADLPPPKRKKSAATGSQPTNWQNEKMKLENRNKELDEQLQKTKHELAKLKCSASIQATQPNSAKNVLETESDNDSYTLKKNVQEFKNAMDKLSEDKEKEITDLKKNNESLKSKVYGLEEQRKTLESLERENADLKANIEKKTRDAEQLQREISDLKQNRAQKMEEERIQRGKSDLTEDNEKKTKDGEELQREISSLTKEKGKKIEEERIQRGKSDHTEDNELRKTLAALRQENATLIAENKKKTKDGEKLQREISSLTKDSESKRKEIEQLRKEKSDVIKDNQEKKKGGGKGNRTSSADEISKLQDEVDGLRNRLSKMAGAQLTDNNPAIADLSDPNRPLSLGEKFSELYDNEWTDAMEEMSETMSDETKVIKLLLDIVCDAYKFCLDKSDRFMDKINSTVNGFSEEFSSSETMPKEIAKTNKDYRKSLAVYVVSFLQKDFAEEMQTKVKAKVGTQTEAYIKRCVFVCWFMTVQDPKVHITTKTTEKFDEDLYKPYTRKGKHIDYLVWPALHLHEGGPLIGKGVAQGKP